MKRAGTGTVSSREGWGLWRSAENMFSGGATTIRPIQRAGPQLPDLQFCFVLFSQEKLRDMPLFLSFFIF